MDRNTLAFVNHRLATDGSLFRLAIRSAFAEAPQLRQRNGPTS